MERVFAICCSDNSDHCLSWWRGVKYAAHACGACNLLSSHAVAARSCLYIFRVEAIYPAHLAFATAVQQYIDPHNPP